MKRIILVGFGAGFLLLAFYFGVLSLSQGIVHTLQQSAKLWYWLLALAGGFGVQAGLFDFIRTSLQKRKINTASVATSGGVSAGSMIACCAHHLNDFLPLLGLSGLTVFLVNYQSLFLVIGVMANIVGIIVMLETIQRYGLCPVLSRLQLNMRCIRKGAMIAAGLVILGTLVMMI